VTQVTAYSALAKKVTTIHCTWAYPSNESQMKFRLLWLTITLVFLMVLSLVIGPVSLSGSDWLGALQGIGSTHVSMGSMVLFELRLPRTLLAVITGAALACGGAAMQSLFRNPLAEPGLVGVSAGAALGAVTAIFVGTQSFLWVGLAGFGGALLATALAWQLSKGWIESSGLLLAGVAINAVVLSLISLMISMASDAEIRSVTFWSLGSFTRAPLGAVLVLVPVVLVCLALLYRQWPALNALLLGERQAMHVGVPVNRLKLRLVILMAVMVGPLVCLTGVISFIGLLVPQFVRRWVGSHHRHLLPMSALVGALAVLMADIAARIVITPAEFPVGVVISLLGAPLFLLVLRQTGIQRPSDSQSSSTR